MSMFMQTHSFPFKKLIAWKLSLQGAFVFAHMDKIAFLFMSFHCDSCRHRAGEPNDLFSTHRMTPHPPHLTGCSSLNRACYTLLPLGGESGSCTTSRGDSAYLFMNAIWAHEKKTSIDRFKEFTMLLFFCFFLLFYLLYNSLLQSVILSSGLVGWSLDWLYL